MTLKLREDRMATIEERKALRTALLLAQEKLRLYRTMHSGEYVGGMEFTSLMNLIDEALK
jgi:hypothetical protein